MKMARSAKILGKYCLKLAKMGKYSFTKQSFPDFEGKFGLISSLFFKFGEFGVLLAITSATEGGREKDRHTQANFMQEKDFS